MVPDCTDDSVLQAPSDGPFAIEYSLTLSDHHALSMFLFDTILRKQLRFRLRSYAVMAFKAALLPVLCGLIVWVHTISRPANALLMLALVFVAGLLFYIVWLIELIPGSFLDTSTRRRIERHYWRTLQRQWQLGIRNAEQNCRVVLTPEGFTETLDSHEKSNVVEIVESKVTNVDWLAVSSIEVTDNYAFFTVENACVSFTNQGFLVLPRLAFDNETRFLEFVNAARSFRDAALRKATASRAFPTPRDSRITS